MARITSFLRRLGATGAVANAGAACAEVAAMHAAVDALERRLAALTPAATAAA